MDMLNFCDNIIDLLPFWQQFEAYQFCVVLTPLISSELPEEKRMDCSHDCDGHEERTFLS